MTATGHLPAWPPSVTSAEEAALVTLSRDYALSHSIIYRPLIDSPSFQTSVIHAPYALFPTPFPRKLFHLAGQIQHAYNAIYAQIACDFSFLEKVIGGNVAKVDVFQGGLWEIAKKIRQEGAVQNIHLGLFRSDYLLHSTPEANDAPLGLKQVEFNTISSSFGALSTKVTDLHRYLSSTSMIYASSNPPLQQKDLPENKALTGLAAGLAEAHRAYGVSECVPYLQLNSKILFVIQDPERNAFDQRALEWELLETHGIRVIRLSFSDLHARASLTSSRSLLFISSDNSSPNSTEISVIYFRAGYAPTDYPTSKEWDIRLLLERSRSIKCPSVALQLAGAKKIQQVLSEPGVLDSFAHQIGLSRQEITEIKETFTALYPLDDTDLGKQALQLAYSEPKRFVLKPQREGGGNNVYRNDIPSFLDELAKQDVRKRNNGRIEPSAREGYILMDLIQPPMGLQNSLVRAGDLLPKQGEVVSELGVFGAVLFRDNDERAHLMYNTVPGHLLRTKGRESDEGGVAVGFSVIDSPFLVD